jgi:hypothetical protein
LVGRVRGPAGRNAIAVVDGEIDTRKVITPSTFNELVAEGESAPLRGWDFSWFDGRATEERPPWGYSRMMAERMAQASAALDIQTGGGEVLAQIPRAPAVLALRSRGPRT